MMIGVLAAISAAVAVAAGAFGAHGAAGPQQAEWLRTGGLYQLVHAVAALAIMGSARGPAITLLVGAAIFAATLYAMALGAPKWKVVVMIAYRAAVQGMVTGVLLAVARISGETAPLLFTALNNQFWSSDLSQPIANLPVVIFQFATSPYDDWQKLAWGGALVIPVAILALNIIARSLAGGKSQSQG